MHFLRILIHPNKITLYKSAKNFNLCYPKNQKIELLECDSVFRKHFKKN